MTDEAPVLIAGGGLVGLSAAAFLASHGIRSLTFERLTASSPLPRAAFFHMRTLEMFRSIGIEEAVRSQSEKEFVPDGAIIAMDTLSGRKLADIIPNLNEGVDALSPCRRLFLNQPSLERILRNCAHEGGATIVPGAEIVDVHQDSTGVDLTIRKVSDGRMHDVRGDYLIAADGGHSRVRAALGIDYEGRGAFSNSLTIYFTADLAPYIGDNPWSLIYVNNPTLRGFFRLNRAATAGFLGVNVLGDSQLAGFLTATKRNASQLPYSRSNSHSPATSRARRPGWRRAFSPRLSSTTCESSSATCMTRLSVCMPTRAVPAALPDRVRPTCGSSAVVSASPRSILQAAGTFCLRAGRARPGWMQRRRQPTGAADCRSTPTASDETWPIPGANFCLALGFRARGPRWCVPTDLSPGVAPITRPSRPRCCTRRSVRASRTR